MPHARALNDMLAWQWCDLVAGGLLALFLFQTSHTLHAAIVA